MRKPNFLTFCKNLAQRTGQRLENIYGGISVYEELKPKVNMISIFKTDPVKKLNRKYKKLMAEARDVQRNGDLRLYAEKIEEAETVAREIEKIKAK